MRFNCPQVFDVAVVIDRGRLRGRSMERIV